MADQKLAVLAQPLSPTFPEFLPLHSWTQSDVTLAGVAVLLVELGSESPGVAVLVAGKSGLVEPGETPEKAIATRQIMVITRGR